MPNTQADAAREWVLPILGASEIVIKNRSQGKGGTVVNIKRKIDLYVLSLGLLFVFLIVITAKFPVCFGVGCEFVGLSVLPYSNVVALVTFILLAYCFVAYAKFKFDLKGTQEIPFEIRKIESINYEHLTFLATYVVPLISFDFGSLRQMLVLGLLLVVMGAIYIKTDLFYANPSLALLGFHIYRASGNFKNGNREDLVIICKGRLNVGEKVGYIKLDERIYFAERVSS